MKGFRRQNGNESFLTCDRMDIVLICKSSINKDKLAETLRAVGLE